MVRVFALMMAVSGMQLAVCSRQGLFARGSLQAEGTSLAQSEAQVVARGMRTRKQEEILESWVDSSSAVTCRMGGDDLTERVAAIGAQEYNSTLSGLVDLAPSRFVTRAGNRQTAEFVRERLELLGFSVTEQPVAVANVPLAAPDQEGRRSGNVIGFLRGTDLRHELVIFGAHYDSVNWEELTATAPGADDDGSGLASLLLLADTVAAEARARPLRRSVAIIAFQAEELGLIGSKAFVAEELTKNDWGTPVATLCADQVSYRGRALYDRKAIFETSGRSHATDAIVDTLSHQAMNEDGISGFEINYHGFGSDHMPFLDAGFPAVLLIERDNEYYADTFGHSSRDTMNNTDGAFGAAMTRLAARTILSFASPE